MQLRKARIRWNTLVRRVTGEAASGVSQPREMLSDDETVALEQLDTIWKAARYALGEPYDEEMSWRMLKQRVEQQEQLENSQRGRRRTGIGQGRVPAVKRTSGERARTVLQRNRYTGLTIKAGVVFLIAGLVSFFGLFFVQNRGVVGTGDHARIITTLPGERATVRLTDGSQVLLNADSRITIPQTFGYTSREVQLEGEAFFDIVRDENHPFVVHSDETVVRVLGTQFGVKAYEEDVQVQVVVLEGSVQFWTRKAITPDTLVLNSREVAFRRDTTIVFDRMADAEAMLAWREGRMVFKATPLSDVARMLERGFGIRITIMDELLAARRFSAEFTSESLQEILQTLTRTMDITFERRRDEIILRSNHTLESSN